MIAGLLFALVISLPLIALEAFVATKLWAWFVVPQFGLDPLTFGMAAGIGLLVELWTHQTPQEVKNDRDAIETLKAAGRRLFMLYARGPVLLFVGWLVRMVVE